MSQDVAVMHRLRTLQAEVATRFELEGENVLRELAKIVHADLRKVFREDGSLMEPSEWPDEIAGAIASIEVFEEYEGQGKARKLVGFTKKIKLWPKVEAIDRAMKHLGQFERDNAQKSMGMLANLPRPVLKLVVEHIRSMKAGGQS